MYVNSTNGGVLYISLLEEGSHGKDKIDLKRKIFLMPPSKIDQFEIKPNKPSYAPGENVVINVLLDQKSLPDEKFFASIVVSDISSYQRLPTFKQSPTLPSMVYLEDEVEESDSKGQFLYSGEFIDPFYKGEKNVDYEERIDLLLATSEMKYDVEPMAEIPPMPPMPPMPRFGSMGMMSAKSSFRPAMAAMATMDVGSMVFDDMSSNEEMEEGTVGEP